MPRLLSLSLLALCLLFPFHALAWEEPKEPAGGEAAKPLELGIFNQLVGSKAGSGKDLTLSGEFTVAENGREGVLRVTAVIEKGWHTYSTSQAAGVVGSIPSTIKVQNKEVQLTGAFSPDKKPLIKIDKETKDTVEQHEGVVVWSAPITLAEGTDPKTLEISVRFDGLVCSDGTEGVGGVCKPKGETILAKYVSAATAPAAVEPTPTSATTSAEPFRLKGAKLTLQGVLDKKTVAPGSKVKLGITAVPDSDWYVYALEKRDESAVSKPTLIVIEESQGFQVSEPVPTSPPKEKETGNPQKPTDQYYPDPVTWTLELQAPQAAKSGLYKVTGLIGFQTCKNGNCLPPMAAAFTAEIEVGATEVAGAAPVEIKVPEPRMQKEGKVGPTTYTNIAALAAGPATPGSTAGGLDLKKIKVDNETANLPLLAILPVALLGGFILNFMPCVLPVIGLKILSFVQQAGESRARVFALNLTYSAGMLAVFLVLATLAVVWNLGWGEQNTSDVFNIVMVSVVFAMGLSLLGVWEIPIPGFVGSGKASELAQKEGLSGAFFKGAVTTLLATPCSGPGLATALAWCNGKPAHLVYLVFIFLGLGMAIPYLVIGAIPGLVKLLPKPGAWMETFKQVMGFVLLGTVVFMFTYMPSTIIVPTIALLFGLWGSCWWIGRTPFSAELSQTVRAWVGAVAFAALVGWFSFSFLANLMNNRFVKAVDREIAQRQTKVAPKIAHRSEHELPWQPFTMDRLKELTAQKKTVMVDFTADWCQTCKWLEANVLNTKDVRKSVEMNQVETLVADWTKPDPVINEMLTAFGAEQIPVLAIFPAGKPNEPIVLIGGYSQATLIKRIEEASASSAKSGETSTAMK